MPIPSVYTNHLWTCWLTDACIHTIFDLSHHSFHSGGYGCLSSLIVSDNVLVFQSSIQEEKNFEGFPTRNLTQFFFCCDELSKCGWQQISICSISSKQASIFLLCIDWFSLSCLLCFWCLLYMGEAFNTAHSSADGCCGPKRWQNLSHCLCSSEC